MYDIMNLNYIIKRENVTFYGYRQARPKLHVVSFERYDREIKELEERLHTITKTRKDNHVLFEVKVDEYVLALQFTDDKMWLGLGIEKQRW